MAQPPAEPPDREPGDDWPDHDWPDDNWADDEWPDDDWPADYQPVPRAADEADLLTWLHANALVVAVVAVLAGVAGAFVAFLLTQGPSAPSAATKLPASAAPSPAIGGGNALGGGPGGANGQVQMLIVGKVTAVSSTSITIEGQGNEMTGAVTSATQVTGKVTGISGVKVGDQVLVKFTGAAGASHLTATEIQDPASIS
jgi:hypothetical protein